MAIRNGKSTSAIPGLYIKSKDAVRDAVLQFDAVNTAPTSATGYYYLYVATDGSLAFNNGSTITTIGAAGSVSSATWDGIYAADKTLNVSGTTFTIDGTHATNDVLTLTATGAGTGDVLQITNVGTGKDINGTSGTWSFTKAGVNVMKSTTIAGTAGSTSLTLTAGDAVLSDGSLAITDADDAASFTVTNNTATTASVVVLAGSGVFTGSTTTSFFTITPSGLTTGTAVYLPVAALTTGKALNVVANALTTGVVIDVTSSAAAITGNGRLLSIAHSGATTTSGVISEFSTAAGDETVLMKLTASGLLALGTILQLSGSSVTTGNGITVADLDSLTDGYGIHIASAATAITSTGHLLYVDHTGATGTSAVLSEFKTAATDETTVVKITTAAMVSGIGLNIVGTTGMTTGSLIRATSSTAGAVATNGIYSFKGTGAYTSTSNAGLVDIGATATTAGTVVHITSSAAAQTATALLYVEASGFTTGYTGDVVTFKSSSTTGDAAVLNVTSANTTDGSAIEVTSGATTTNGRAIKVVAEGLTTGVGIGFAHTTSVIADGGSMVRLSDSGIATGGATNGFMLDVRSTATVAGTLVKLVSSAAAQTTACILDIVSSGYTTGFTGSVVKITGASTTGSGAVLTVTGANTTAGETVKVDAAALTTGTGLLVTSAGVLVTTGELVSLVANSATTCTGVLRASATALTDGWVAEFTGGGANFSASGGVLNLAMGAATVGTGVQVVSTGVYTGTTGLLALTANSATTGVIAAISATSLTTGSALKITTNATATGEYINCYDGAAVDFKVSRYGAVTIAGNALGTAALTLTTGDIVVSNGSLNVANKFILSSVETIAAGNPGALSLTNSVHHIDADAGGDTFTLADGTVGQIMTIVMDSATGVATITPSNLAGGTSVTLNAAGDSVVLQFIDTDWYILGGNSYAIV
jgi:hypothetical protein